MHDPKTWRRPATTGSDNPKSAPPVAGAVSLTPQGVMGVWLVAGMLAGIVVGFLVDRLFLATFLGVGLGIAVGAYASRGRRGTTESADDPVPRRGRE